MRERFNPGDHGVLNEISWRVVQGKKAVDDCRLDILCPTWRAVPMSLGFLFADFFAETEDVLYPPADGRRGAEMYATYCEGAVRLGWVAAHEQLLMDRARKVAA